MAKTQKEMRARIARSANDSRDTSTYTRAQAGAKSVSAGRISSSRTDGAKPQLRVLERQKRLAGFRISHKMLFAYGVGFMALFAAVVMRAEMAATQLRLNSLNAQLTSLRTQHLKLEVELSSLESPSRIVSYAETHLGMIYPAQVGYLGANPVKTTQQNNPTALTQQVISSSNTLFAPPGEAGGGAPTRPLTPITATQPSALKATPGKSGVVPGGATSKATTTGAAPSVPTSSSAKTG